MNKGLLIGIGAAVGVASAAVVGYFVYDKKQVAYKKYCDSVNADPEKEARATVSRIIRNGGGVITALRKELAEELKDVLAENKVKYNAVITETIDALVIIRNSVDAIVEMHGRNEKFLREELDKEYAKVSKDDAAPRDNKFYNLAIIAFELNRLDQKDKARRMSEYEARLNAKNFNDMIWNQAYRNR